MNLSLNKGIRAELAKYLLNEISLEDFEDWFVSASWNVHQSKDQSAINLVYEIELWLSEYSDGFRSENELRNLLRPLVENYIIKAEIGYELQFSSTAQLSYWSIYPVSSRILYSEIL